MHVDMDAFYASVEQRDRPELRGKPVIVGGLSARGVVATASYEARKYGVHSAMPGVVARQRCPEGIFIRSDIKKYRAVSDEIHEVLLHYAPALEPLSLDEAFLDVSGMGTHFPDLGALGRAVKKDIYKATQLTASVGIAPNKFLAKLASDWHKPDGLTIIPYGKEKEMIAPLPLRRLWGVGEKTEAILTERGWRTIGDIAAADPAELEQLLGTNGRRLHELANGIDERPVNPNEPRKSIGEEETYPRDLTDEEIIRRNLARHCDVVARRLRDADLRARTVTLKLRFGSFRTLTRSRTVDRPMDLQQELFSQIIELYNKIEKTEGIRLLGVTASNLVPVQDEISLFPDKRDKQRRATKAMDALREKYGKDVVRPGFWWDGPQKEDSEHESE